MTMPMKFLGWPVIKFGDEYLIFTRTMTFAFGPKRKGKRPFPNWL